MEHFRGQGGHRSEGLSGSEGTRFRPAGSTKVDRRPGERMLHWSERRCRLPVAVIALLSFILAVGPVSGETDDPTGFVDILFYDSFEGEGFTGGSISGQVLFDPNRDGVLTDGERRPGVTVYLDSNFNGRLDAGEPVETTDAEGFYQFIAVPAGIHHVRQLLVAPEFQTFPEGGIVPALDRLPDEVVQYVHAPAGVGDFDVPYGNNATDWPAEWDMTVEGPMPKIVDSVDLVLNPIGVRNIMATLSARRGTEFICLPMGAEITLRFDEAMIDGPGTDLLVYSLSRRTAGEMVEILVGPDPSQLTSLGLYSEDDNTISIDFAGAGGRGPINYVRAVGQDTGGSWKGFELVGMEAINFADPDPSAHIVTVDDANRIYTNKNFGRFAQDLPPTLTVGLTDNEPGTPELRAGESATVEVAAFDDLAISTLALIVNGQSVPLDSNHQAVVNLVNAGEILLQATATDTGNQTVTRSAAYYVVNADGSRPNNPSLAGQRASSAATSPRVKILSPAPGTSATSDQAIIASITGSPEPTSWTLEFAPVADVDPNNLSGADPDYLPLAAGSGSLVSTEIGTVPLSTLADGIYFVRLGALNAMGQFAYFGQVLAKNVAEGDLRPQVVIDSPASGDQVTMTVDIVGTIQSTRPLSEWYVEYAEADTVDLNNLGSNVPDWKRIASGNATIDAPAPIANLDVTLLRNNSYVVRIVAENDIGLGWVEPLALEVTGEAKLGRNRLEFTDVSVILAGFPLTFTRVYDSMDANRDGELGYGWSLKLQDTDVAETVPDTGVLGLFGSTPFRIGTRVYINAPTGERLGFTFNTIAGAPTLTGTPHSVQFDPDPGNYYRLEVPQGNEEFLRVKDDGNVYLFSIQFPYNPEKYVLITPEGLRYTVHEDKGLLGAQDLNGNSLSFNTEGVQHSAGPSLSFTRDGQGRITAIADPEGNTWNYAYDASGDLVSVTDPDMNITSYIYSVTNPHYLDTIMDPQGRMPKRYEYDPVDGRLVAIIDENGNRRENTVDPLGFSGMSTDGRGNTTYFEYDARGNPTLVEDHGGNTVTYEYNDPANPDRETRLVDATGEQWLYQYDAMGRPTRLTPPLSSFATQRYEAAYDASGNMTRFKTPDGIVTNYIYDDNGNRISEAPADFVTTDFAYGPSGQLLRRSTSNDYAITYGYDANGYFASASDPNGYQLQITNLKNGRPVQRTDNKGTQDVAFTPVGRLDIQQDANGNSAAFVRNSDGSLTRTDRSGNALTVYYDAEGRPVATDLPAGGQIQTRYDPEGNPAVVTDPLGNTVTYTLDYAGRLVGVEDQLGNTQSLVRDANGNVIEIIDRNGKRRTFVWDADRRLTHERWHDSGGAVIREIVFTYNATMGLRRVDDTSGADTYTLAFNGRLPRINHVDYTLPGQSPWRVRYNWTAKDPHPTQLLVGINNATQARITTDFFGGDTLRVEWLHPGNQGGGNELQIFRNPDKTVRQLRRLTGSDGGGATSITDFEYDNLSQVTSIRHTDDLGALLHPSSELTYTRDPEGRLLSETHANNAVIYGYDANGQLISATQTAPGYTDESYIYDLAGNRLTSHIATGMATVTAPNRVTAVGDFSYEYDTEGNLTRRTNAVTGVVTEFVYDHRNRLVQGTVHPSLGAPATSTVTYDYDFKDRLLYREVNGTRTWILHDRLQPIAEFADGATELSATWLYDPASVDQVHAVWRTATTGERWFLRDHLGSIRGITDAGFNVLSWSDYDSFGNLQPGSVPADNEPLRFASRPIEPVLDVYDNRRRFYDPILGRFTQEDPIRYGGRDHNLYRYALNSPTVLIDPTGETPTVASILIGAFATAIAGKTADNSPDRMESACRIANWSASNFAYFDPLAELILDPRFGSIPPDLDRNALINENTGCSFPPNRGQNFFPVP